MVAAIQNRYDLNQGYKRFRLGVMVFLAAVVMLFTSLTSAYIVRIAGNGDWQRLPLPSILIASTALILVSSITLEIGKRSLKSHHTSALRWLMLTTVLGFSFLFTQLMAWRQLVDRGLYLATNSRSSFFYLMTATHAVHLAGGLLALVYVLLRVRATFGDESAQARSLAITDAATLYWHFMDGLWIYLFLLLFFWR